MLVCVLGWYTGLLSLVLCRFVFFGWYTGLCDAGTRYNIQEGKRGGLGFVRLGVRVGERFGSLSEGLR